MKKIPKVHYFDGTDGCYACNKALGKVWNFNKPRASFTVEKKAVTCENCKRTLINRQLGIKARRKVIDV